MIYLIAFACVLAYGLWYAADPMKSLRRKYGEDDVPPVAVKTARIMGIVIALIGAAGIVYAIVTMVTAGG